MSLVAALSGIPKELSAALSTELANLMHRFARGDWGPSELNGGRLAETVLRYVEWKNAGSFTPFGAQLNRSRVCTSALNNVALDDSLRFHIPNAAQLIMDVRNKRDVAHLSAVVDVNEMDSHLAVRLASWIVAEIVRLEAGLAPSEIQRIVDSLSSKHVPLVEVFGGETVVVAPGLSAAQRVLIALYHSHPSPCAVATLRRSVKYGNVTRFRGILQALDREGRTHLKGNDVYLTRLGVVDAEGLIS